MFCKYCGAKLKPESKFCESCGKPRDVKTEPEKNVSPISHAGNSNGEAHNQKLNSAQSSPAEKEQDFADEKISNENEKGSPAAVIVITIIATIVLVGVMAAVFGSGSSQTSSDPANGSASASSSVITALYTIGTANVRTCGSSDCKSIGTYPAGTKIDLTGSIDWGYSDFSQLPDWVAFVYTDASGTQTTYYISKSLLSDQQLAETNAGEQSGSSSNSNSQTNQAQSQSTDQTSSGGNLTTALINRIEPSIVEINCYSANGNVVVSGSGTSNLNNGVLHITTNYHVYNEASGGGGSPTCYAVYPEPPDFSYNPEYGDYQLTLVSHAYDTDTYEDEAEFTIGSLYPSATPLSPLPSINTLPLTGMGAEGCSDAVVGDSVTVFGYPASGNALGISETVTQGTIAGILPGPIYKFDGAIDHGNSGGLAVLDKDSCVLGIPTLGDSGLTAGIGYIQSFSLASQPVTQTNAQVCENDYGPYSVWGGQLNSTGGPTCDCEEGYTWNSDQTECVAMTPDQICEQDVGAGSYYLGYNNPNGSYACSSPY